VPSDAVRRVVAIPDVPSDDVGPVEKILAVPSDAVRPVEKILAVASDAVRRHPGFPFHDQRRRGNGEGRSDTLIRPGEPGENEWTGAFLLSSFHPAVPLT
jgi:hypothetical protein